MPNYAAVFLLFTLANVGLPGTSGFVGEFLVLVGIFQVNNWVAFLATTGLVLSAAYALWLYRRVIFGTLTKADLKDMVDLNKREVAIFAPLVILVLLFGVYPAPVLDVMHESVANLIHNHEVAMQAARDVATVAK
jgi:NADH-quinone oxidoreductase subunit M